ncbi:MAG: hypothetical protein KA791_01975 [Flavobacteriales bacterium]|nr:hypothetical protein [Flavobacteriales bacterium]
MKTLARIAAFSGTLLIGGLAFGQDKPAPAATPEPAKETVAPAAAPAAPVKPRVHDGWRGIPLGMIVKQVGLTPEQTQKGKELNAKYMKDYQALDANMPLEERKVKVKEMMDAREVEVKAMLTPEQLEKYKNMRAPNGDMHGQRTTANPKMEGKPGTVKETAPVQEKK